MAHWGYKSIDGEKEFFKPAVAFAVSFCVGLVVATSFAKRETMAYSATIPQVSSSTLTASSTLPQRALRLNGASVQGPYAAEMLEDMSQKQEEVPSNDGQSNSATLMGCTLLSVASLALFALRRKEKKETLAPVNLNSLHFDLPSFTMASAAGAKSPVYVINGFYMAMREKYTQDGAAIQYMLAEWDPSALSWKDFRGKVLGATDPTTAPEGSIRRTILETYKDLGLATEPNVGDNGVHASASPFEALVERMNWIGAQLETDDFGKALLEAGIPKDTILAWTKDPQVEFEGQKRGLFDVMEDLNAEDCLKRAQIIAGASGPIVATKNQAFVFVKPHAMTSKAIELAQSKLTAAGIKLGASGRLDNKTIESKMLIDNHYYAIANKASLTKPADLNPPAAKQDEFEQLFGEKWADALASGKVFNALDACKELGINGNALDDIWGAAKKSGKLVKFGGGFYVGQLNP